MTYNVDQAMREEKHEATKWVNRKNRVIALIKEVDADIVCLQEMRKLPETPSVNSFLAEFEQYFYEVGYRNASTLAFGQVIMYKPTKFYAWKKMTKWLSSTPDLISDDFNSGTTGVGSMLLGVCFYPVQDSSIISDHLGKGAFWIYNAHFVLDEEIKRRSSICIKQIMKDYSAGLPFLVAGDFNFFPDRDGAKHRAIMCTQDYPLNDLGYGAVTFGGRHVEGTFVGFDHDEFKADLNNMVSRLDHIFATEHFVPTSVPVLYTKTMLPEEPPELTTRLYPSDHLPLVIDLRIN